MKLFYNNNFGTIWELDISIKDRCLPPIFTTQAYEKGLKNKREYSPKRNITHSFSYTLLYNFIQYEKIPYMEKK